MDVTVAVATFGDASWVDLAERRAIPSAIRLGVPVLHVHGDTLHDARNEACSRVDTEWVVHLDADDELDDQFLVAMAAGSGDLRVPSVRYVRNGGRPAPVMPRVSGHQHGCTARCLPWGNWMVIGTAVRADMVREVGGWRDFPWSEDWDLWVRCWQAGAAVEATPDAVYIAHVRRDSRNRAPSHASKLAAHQAIAAANGLPVPA